jgi:hypothetical protein
MARRSGLSVPKAITASRRRSLLLRIEEHGLPAVLDAIDRIGRSRFCRGENDRGWRADLDFLASPRASYRSSKANTTIGRCSSRNRRLDRKALHAAPP